MFFPPNRHRPLRSASLLMIVCCLAAASCGGADEAVPATTSAPPTTVATTVTTLPPTTTTAPPETSTTVAGPLAPLTGVPLDDVTALERPALALKIDNFTSARPQMGLDLADIVFDLRAESVTRFMAVFHSQLPAVVGPVRSSRTSDFDLLRGLGYPMYGSSGGNDNVIAGLRSVPAQVVTAETRSEYFRDTTRPRPHNLFVAPAELLAVANESTGVPSPWFDYGVGVVHPTATLQEAEVKVDFTGGPTVRFTWDAERQGWARTQNGEPHLSAGGIQLAPPNVVIMETSYGTSSADATSPEVRSTGTGPVLVLTGGHAVEGTWTREAASDRPTLLGSDGSPIVLAPGQTWVLYPEAGQTSH